MKKKNKATPPITRANTHAVNEQAAMADVIYFCNDKKYSYNECEKFAEQLINSGYGDVKQGLKEFIKNLKTVFTEPDCMIIDSFFQDLYGEKPDTIDGDKVGLYNGIITIICDDAREGKTPRVKKLYQTFDYTPDEPFTFTTLNDCLKIIEFDGEGVVTVIFEEGLKGEIYEYGNYAPKCWVKHGTTKGYA